MLDLSRTIMAALERIRVPVALVLLLTLCATFLTPAYPVEVQRTEERGCLPSGICRDYANYTEAIPAVLVISSGFSWSTRTLVTDGETIYSYDASPTFLSIHLLLAVGILVILILKTREREQNWSLNLRRRYWRAFLWAMGFYWAWSYLIFYGVSESAAAVDPLLMSTIGTFLLSGLGLALMMLSVRSRAIWPAFSKE